MSSSRLASLAAQLTDVRWNEARRTRVGEPLERSERIRLEQRLTGIVSQLLRSVDAYESGFTDEARRMALSIRVLLHDTRKQISLLTHLGLKSGITMYDTASEVDPRQLGAHFSLLTLLLPAPDGKPEPARLEARLDGQPASPKPEMQGFDEWWNAVAIRDDDGHHFSRRDIILYLANKDGGAHVDLHVDPIYLRLASGEAGSWRRWGPGTNELIENIELATARQVTHEVLVSLARHHPGFFAISQSARRYADDSFSIQGEGIELPDMRIYSSSLTLGRNEPCWCGSGRKFKQCHDGPAATGRPDRGKQRWST